MECRKILVIEKQTSFEFVRENLKKSSRRYKELEKSHNEHKLIRDEVTNTISNLGASYDLIKDKDVDNVDCSIYDDVVIVGGDGTFLHGAKYVSNQPILGINTDIKKSLGQLMNHNRTNFKSPLKAMIKGIAKFEIWNRLSAKINGKKLPYVALNEIFIGHDSIKKASHLEIRIENKKARVIGNGIIIATRKGSTAMYESITKSSFNVKGIGYAMVLPFRRKGNLCENQVLPIDTKIYVVPKRQGYSVSFDCDDNHDITIKQEDEIEISIDKEKGLRVVV